MIPGWPYSFVAAVEPGRTSWTTVLDVTRVHPDDDHTDRAAAQERKVAILEGFARAFSATAAPRP